MTTPNTRYRVVTEQKADGATYTPKVLADFVAKKITEHFHLPRDGRHSPALRVLDPAIGDGELLMSLAEQLSKHPNLLIEVHGFETNPKAVARAAARLRQRFPNIQLHFQGTDFLRFVSDTFALAGGGLFTETTPEGFDMIIANPPYVRTQVLGAKQAQFLAARFGLLGRVDLYHAFIVAMAKLLKPRGTAG